MEQNERVATFQDFIESLGICLYVYTVVAKSTMDPRRERERRCRAFFTRERFDFLKSLSPDQTYDEDADVATCGADKALLNTEAPLESTYTMPIECSGDRGHASQDWNGPKSPGGTYKIGVQIYHVINPIVRIQLRPQRLHESQDSAFFKLSWDFAYALCPLSMLLFNLAHLAKSSWADVPLNKTCCSKSLCFDAARDLRWESVPRKTRNGPRSCTSV